MNADALNAAAQAIRIRFGHIPMMASDCAEVAVAAYLEDLRRQNLRPCLACDGFGDLPTGECNPGDMGVVTCSECHGTGMDQ